MSRIGKKSISIPDNVTIEVKNGFVIVKGLKGELKKTVPVELAVKKEEEREIKIVPAGIMTKKTAALWGLFRALVANMVVGVSRGFEKKLWFEGVGYRASVEGDVLVMQLGFSHPVKVKAPFGIQFVVNKNVITVSGFDKELVGDTAAQIKNLKPVEPYKGKGIRYEGETFRKKAGKKAVAAA